MSSRLNKEDEEIVDWALSVTNLEGYEYRLFTFFIRRTATCLDCDDVSATYKFVLLDEPTTFLDIVHQLEVMELVETIK